MHTNDQIKFGPADELLTESELSRLYNVRLRRLMVQTGEHFQSTICPVFGIREPDQDMPISYPLNKGKY
ncbi:hypothetical protein, partial [Oceanimonas smirnovii]